MAAFDVRDELIPCCDNQSRDQPSTTPSSPTQAAGAGRRLWEMNDAEKVDEGWEEVLAWQTTRIYAALVVRSHRKNSGSSLQDRGGQYATNALGSWSPWRPNEIRNGGMSKSKL